MASHFYLRTPSSSKTSSVSTNSTLIKPMSSQISHIAPQTTSHSQQRTTLSSAPTMRLPSGYTTDHWAWSMSDPSFRAAELTTLPWDEFDDAFLFPMMSLKEPLVLTTELEDDFQDQISSSDGTASLNSSSTTQSKPTTRQPSRPYVARAQSYAQARAPKAKDDTKRANSITLPMIKSVRHARKQQQTQRAQDAYKQRKVSELLTLRRQIADLTQRLSMLMANQCTACRLGIIDCGLGNGNGTREVQPILPPGNAMRDQEREAEIEGRIQRLTRQAQMMAF